MRNRPHTIHDIYGRLLSKGNASYWEELQTPSDYDRISEIAYDQIIACLQYQNEKRTVASQTVAIVRANTDICICDNRRHTSKYFRYSQ